MPIAIENRSKANLTGISSNSGVTKLSRSDPKKGHHKDLSDNQEKSKIRCRYRPIGNAKSFLLLRRLPTVLNITKTRTIVGKRKEWKIFGRIGIDPRIGKTAANETSR